MSHGGALRHVVKRTVHRERAQLSTRSKLGLLEKKKDYQVRAKEHKKRKNYIANLKTKAFLKNPDEFYFKMASTKQRDDGKIELGGALSAEQKALARDQDLSYVVHRRQIDLKRVEKLKQGAFLNAEQAAHYVFEDSDDGEGVKKIAESAEASKGVLKANKAAMKIEQIEERAGKLTQVMELLQTRKNLADKHGKKKRVTGSDGSTVCYKWEPMRKR